MDSFLNLLKNIANYLPLAGLILATVGAMTFILWLLLKLYNYLRLLRQEYVYLELTPPAFSDKLPEATGQLFTALYALGSSRRWRDRLLQRRSVFSLEIVSTKGEGIRFLVRTPADKAASMEQTVEAYLPEVKVRHVDDYINGATADHLKIAEFSQAAHFAYPLKDYVSLESHDPIAYLTNAMTKLQSGELMALQLLITPLRVRKAERLSTKILSNEDLLPLLTKDKTRPARWLLDSINNFLFGVTGAVSSGLYGQSKVDYQAAQKDLDYQKQIAKRIKPVRTLSYFEHELIESIHIKLAQPLFLTNIRCLIATDSRQELLSRKKSVETAVSLYGVPKYQSLRAHRNRYGWLKTYQRYAFRHRLPSFLRSPNLLASSELAGLYHFPHSVTGKTENVIKSMSKTLPAPVSLKSGAKLDILIGENQHHGTNTRIGLTAAERERHIYIIGGTGNGKTTMLLYGIVQDIKNGKGVAVLDPHGDLSETILKHVPEERIKDVIYLNPDDISYPVGLNLLELSEGLSGDDLLREKDLVTESTISVMRKIFSEDDSGGHRIEYVLRNTIQTALTLDEPTLFTVFDLLNDPKFRKGVVKGLKDKDLQNFWKYELGKAGEFQRVKMAAGITAKVGRFLFSASAKRILEQPKSTIDFDDILSTGKILICNFSKGLLGEDTSTLFGTTVLAKLQTAALRRARLQQTERRPFYLYVDEFQNFATMSFVQMLSEARKYQLFLTMAEQSTSQQDQQRLVDIILANVGTVICFRSGSPADERFVLPLFKPFIEEGEIANLPSFQFYMRIAAIQAQEPLSGITVLMSDNGNQAVADQAKQLSRQNYAIEYKEVIKKNNPDTNKTVQKTQTKVRQTNKPPTMAEDIKG